MLLFFGLNSVVEFKDEDFVKKAIETMNKHDLSGRPLNIKEVRTNVQIHCRIIVDVLLIIHPFFYSLFLLSNFKANCYLAISGS